MSVFVPIPVSEQAVSHTWKTTIQENINGGEKRSAIFTWPRVTLDNTYQLTTDEEIRFMHTHLFREVNGVWGIPVFSDVTTLTAEAASGQKVMTVAATDYRHFYSGRHFILVDPNNWESDEVGVTGTVDSATQITTEENLEYTWPIGTLVYPIFGCWISDTQKLSAPYYKINGIRIEAKERIATDRHPGYTLPTIDTGVFPVYNSLNLFLKRPQNPAAEQYNFPHEVLRFNGYDTDWYQPGRETRVLFNRTHLYTSKKEIYDLLDFFDAKQGRFGSFYLPTYMEDIKINTAFLLGDTVLDVKTMYYTETEIVGKHVYIQFPDGSYVCREISASTGDTSITLDSAIGTTVQLGSLPQVLCCFLYEVRFNIDELKIDYMKRDALAKIQMSFKQLL